MRSGYSSEPILAEAAANLMQQLRMIKQSNDDYPKDRIANILKRHIDNGLVSKGELGELIGRLLLILAIDGAQEVTQGIHPPQWSKPIGLIDFMKSLLGTENYEEHVRRCVPDNSSGVAFEDYFQNSVIRFTHFARADDDSGVTTEAACAAFVRGLGVQCNRCQQSADAALSVLINKNEPVEEENMTMMLISFKNRSKARNLCDTAIDADVLGCFPESDVEEQDTPGEMRSYICLIMELGVQPRLEVGESSPTTKSTLKRSKDASAKPRKKVKTVASASTSREVKIESKVEAVRRSPRGRGGKRVHPRYVIRICGCSPAVYGVVHNKDVYAHLLHTRRIFTEHARGQEFVSAVRQLKPFFSKGPHGRGHWYGKSGDMTNDEPDAMADGIDVGRPAGEQSSENSDVS